MEREARAEVARLELELARARECRLGLELEIAREALRRLTDAAIPKARTARKPTKTKPAKRAANKPVKKAAQRPRAIKRARRASPKPKAPVMPVAAPGEPPLSPVSWANPIVTPETVRVTLADPRRDEIFADWMRKGASTEALSEALDVLVKDGNTDAVAFCDRWSNAA